MKNMIEYEMTAEKAREAAALLDPGGLLVGNGEYNRAVVLLTELQAHKPQVVTPKGITPVVLRLPSHTIHLSEAVRILSAKIYLYDAQGRWNKGMGNE